MIGKYIRRNAELTEQIKSLTEENEQLRNQASHESMGSFQHNSSQSEFAEYSGTNLREAFTRNAEQFDSLMVAMLAENEQLSIHYESEKRRADDRADENLQLRRQIKAMRETESGEMAQLKANEKQLLENGRGYEERIRELQLEDYDKALMINALKANEQRYIGLLLSTKERLIRYGKGGFVDPNCIAMDIGDALAQSPQQVEVYRAAQELITAVQEARPFGTLSIGVESALDDYQAAIDKADKGE